MSKPGWARFESSVNQKLGLEATAASGATWKDKGDGSTRNSYDEAWPLLVDAKTTEKASFSLKAKFLEDMRKVAQQNGKSFALPLKFTEEPSHKEWVVVPLDDYAYLVEEHRRGKSAFSDEERTLIGAVANQLKGETHEMVLHILAKMRCQR